MSKTFEYDVFLSYSTKDEQIVHALAERLKKDGLRVWLDAWAIVPGDSIPLKIQHGLEQSRTLLMCMSKAYFGSDWGRLEHQTLLFLDPSNAQRRFIPLLIEDCTPPDIIAQFAYIDCRRDSEKAYKRLLTACQREETEKAKQAKAVREEKSTNSIQEIAFIAPVLDEPTKSVSGRPFIKGTKNSQKSISKCEIPEKLSNTASFNPSQTSSRRKNRKKASKSTTDRVYIIGREKQVDDFSRWVLDFNQAEVISDNVLLICIWGFGGVGKTTLLKKFGEICDSDKWLITGMSENNSTIQTPHPAEPLSVFLSRIHRFENKPSANEFETISNFVLSLPSRSALLVDEFRSNDKDFVNSFEWMISQMANQANHRYLIITTCRPRPRFHSVQVDYYVGTEQGLPPLTLEKTREYLNFYWKGDPRNKHINEIFDVTHGNPKVINYLYANREISEKILSHSDTSALNEAAVIRATWEYLHNHEDFRRIADLAAVMGMVSIACPNDIFDQMIENWYELKKAMLDQSLLEQVGSEYKIHDLLRDYHYENMHNADKRQQHCIVGNYYEVIRNHPVIALEHYVLGGYKEGIQRVYKAAYKVMERNSDYKSIIRLVGTYINIFGAKDEFDIDVVTDQGMSYRILTDYRSALSEFELALSLCNQHDITENSLKRAKILWGLGETYRRLDRYRESLEFYDKSLAIYRTHENDDGNDGIARSERGKSAVYKMISRYQESLQGYLVACNLYLGMGNLDGQLYCGRGIAAVNILQGLYIQAQKGYVRSLDLYRKANNPRGIAYACWGYAESLRLQGAIEPAITAYYEALNLSKKIGDDWSVIYLNFNLGECYRAKRDFSKAREWYDLVKKLGTYQSSPILRAHYLLATAELQRLEGNADSELYRQAEKMYQEVPMGLRWGVAHSRIGLCLAELITLKDENDSQWKDCMDSIIDYCDQNQLPNELQTAKRIIEEKDPDELHPLSFP